MIVHQGRSKFSDGYLFGERLEERLLSRSNFIELTKDGSVF
jgi:hypothetical protein